MELNVPRNAFAAILELPLVTRYAVHQGLYNSCGCNQTVILYYFGGLSIDMTVFVLGVHHTLCLTLGT